MDSRKIAIKLAILLCYFHLTRTTLPLECDHLQADVIFLVDVSGSIKPTEMEKMRSIISAVVHDLPVANETFQVGLAAFSFAAKMRYLLNQSYAKVDIVSELRNISHTGGPTNIQKAISTINQEGFSIQNGARPSVPQILVILTDGKPSPHSFLTRELDVSVRRQPEATGAVTVAIGVGPDSEVDKAFLQTITSNASLAISYDDYIFPVDLTNELLNIICKNAQLGPNAVTTMTSTTLHWAIIDKTQGPSLLPVG